MAIMATKTITVNPDLSLNEEKVELTAREYAIYFALDAISARQECPGDMLDGMTEAEREAVNQEIEALLFALHGKIEHKL